jgi:hypothetical protein
VRDKKQVVLQHVHEPHVILMAARERSFKLRLTEMAGGSILPDESEMDM